MSLIPSLILNLTLSMNLTLNLILNPILSLDLSLSLISSLVLSLGLIFEYDPELNLSLILSLRLRNSHQIDFPPLTLVKTSLSRMYMSAYENTSTPRVKTLFPHCHCPGTYGIHRSLMKLCISNTLASVFQSGTLHIERAGIP